MKMRLKFRIFSLISILSILMGSVHVSSVSAQPAQAATNRTVTNTNRYGAGSLGQAFLDSLSGDTIDFDPMLAGQTIYYR